MFQVPNPTWSHEMCHIGNMNADFKGAIAQINTVKSIIDISAA